jgi:anti-sigma B factor antagonist
MSDTEPFDVAHEAGITIAIFRQSFSQLDEMTIEVVNRKLGELVSSLQPPILILDMSEVDFFGSSFIESVFRAWKRLQSRPGAKFALCHLKPYCREVLEVTHLNQLWLICDTREEAIAHLR